MTVPLPKPWVLSIAPYVPGRAATDGGGKAVKLSSNENPLGTSDAARAAFAGHVADLDRYPDAAAVALRDAIGAGHGIEPERIIHGTGSDEVLHLVAGAYAGPGDEVVYVRYGFAVYDIATRRVGATPVVAPDRDYGTDVDALLACVTPRTRMVFVANPNNPTGTFIERAELARLHAGLPPEVMLVVDGAYAEYLGADEDDGALELARHAPNVLVTRTFSKIHGLAAERIGWGYGPAAAIDAMNRIRAPFGVTSAGQAAAIAALGAHDFVAASRDLNTRERARMTAAIEALGLRVVPSRANFVLIVFDGQPSAEDAYRGLMERGWITRWLPGQGLPNALRVTVGTEAEVTGFVAALADVVAATGARAAA